VKAAPDRHLQRPAQRLREKNNRRSNPQNSQRNNPRSSRPSSLLPVQNYPPLPPRPMSACQLNLQNSRRSSPLPSQQSNRPNYRHLRLRKNQPKKSPLSSQHSSDAKVI